MFLYRKINLETGMFIEDAPLDAAATLDDGTPDPAFVSEPCPSGFFWPRWDGTQWVEGGTAPDPVPTEPTIEERLAAVEAATLDLILGGAL